ncbi:MAG: hypothetical protein VX899_04010 [Myxococcota bacterium]|nr:hypothetical protein [Myxococcota bacterium]
MTLLLLSSCAWIQERSEPPWDCDFSATETGWDTPFQGGTAQQVVDHWEGTTRYAAIGGLAAVSEHPGAEWGTGWTLTLESNAPPMLRESWDCGEHLSVPFSWTLALDNGGIWESGHGDSVQQTVDADGEIRVFGPRPEDWTLFFSDDQETGYSSAYETAFPDRDNERYGVGLTLEGSADIGQLSVYWLGSPERIASANLQGLVVSREAP